MNKTDLTKKVKAMKFGDCFDVESIGDSPMFTTITKTRWFDNYVFVIGGACNHTVKLIVIQQTVDGYEDVSEEVVYTLYNMFNHDDSIKYKITATTHLTLEVDHGGLANRKVDNFVYHR